MNKADAQRIAGDYQSKGYRKAKSVDESDEIVLTTCSVRQSAEDRVFGTVRNLTAALKRKKLKPKLILTGCMLHYGQDKLRQLLPEVDEFLPISEVGFNHPQIHQDSQHAWVPINHGCNSFCTYCIVPLARGREKSRHESEVLKEIKDLVNKNYQHITLLGQNVNSYGLEKIKISERKDPQNQYRAFKGKPPFVNLLDKICALSRDIKISFITSNPWDFYEEIIDCIVHHPQIDRLIHLPVQSGDDVILRKMNRGYTSRQYLQLIDRIRKKIPDVHFSTDIIVGFPGETKQQFQQTVNLCQKVGFEIAYIAKYSPRPGTASARIYPDDVPFQEKKRRWILLDNLINHDDTTI